MHRIKNVVHRIKEHALSDLRSGPQGKLDMRQLTVLELRVLLGGIAARQAGNTSGARPCVMCNTGTIPYTELPFCDDCENPLQSLKAAH